MKNVLKHDTIMNLVLPNCNSIWILSLKRQTNQKEKFAVRFLEPVYSNVKYKEYWNREKMNYDDQVPILCLLDEALVYIDSLLILT